MSQITDHVLDPYNVPVLLEVDRDKVISSISSDLSDISFSDVFGFGSSSKKSWIRVLRRYLIIDMFSSTKAVTLDEEEIECLVGAAFTNIDGLAICDLGIYAP